MVKISLFGLPGTGTSKVGKLYAKIYSLDFVSSGNMFRDIARGRGLSVYELTEICSNNSKIDRELDNKIKLFGINNDNFIIDSRLAWFTISDSIKIKFVTDDIIRFKRISQRDNISLDEVEIKTKNREASERKRYFSYYNIEDYSEDKNFDYIIDTTNLTPEEICDKIKEYINNFY